MLFAYSSDVEKVDVLHLSQIIRQTITLLQIRTVFPKLKMFIFFEIGYWPW